MRKGDKYNTTLQFRSKTAEEIEIRAENYQKKKTFMKRRKTMKYYIIPKREYMMEINADNKDDAIIKFATNMDTDMNIYFKVVTEEELEKIKENESDSAAHARFVTKFMEDELLNSFDVPKEDAHDVAVDAYDIYCEGNGQTEYECIEEAYNNWINGV